MSKPTETDAFISLVKKLAMIATDHPDIDRRFDAVRTLGAFCLLLDGWKPDGGGETVDLSAYRKPANDEKTIMEGTAA